MKLTEQHYRFVLLFLVEERPLIEAIEIARLLDEDATAATQLLNTYCSETTRTAVGFDPMQIEYPFAFTDPQIMDTASAIVGRLLTGSTPLERVMFSLPSALMEQLSANAQRQHRMIMTAVLGAATAEQFIRITEEVLAQ